MKIQQQIEQKLRQNFEPLFLQITNDSWKHAGHSAAGQETHFTVEIISEKFSGLNQLQRHRLVYACLSEELTEGKVHALALKLKSPQEQ